MASSIFPSRLLQPSGTDYIPPSYVFRRGVFHTDVASCREVRERGTGAGGSGRAIRSARSAPGGSSSPRHSPLASRSAKLGEVRLARVSRECARGSIPTTDRQRRRTIKNGVSRRARRLRARSLPLALAGERHRSASRHSRRVSEGGDPRYTRSSPHIVVFVLVVVVAVAFTKPVRESTCRRVIALAVIAAIISQPSVRVHSRRRHEAERR